MRTLVFAIALSATLGLVNKGRAQTPLAGPLAAPDAPPAAATSPKSANAKASHRKKVAHHATSASPDAGPSSPSGRPAAPTSNPRTDSGSDAVSLGMKWSGNNDSAAQTRVQNYNGTATGTGGEVGLNFHF